MYVSDLEVDNFRSLKNFKILDLKPFVVFYGQNDTGKSNILSFLELVFKEKYLDQEAKTPSGEVAHYEIKSGFWHGYINDFSDNIYKGYRGSIDFSIKLKFNKNEIFENSKIRKILKEHHSTRKKIYLLKLEGKITQEDDQNRGYLELEKVVFDGKKVLAIQDGKSMYLPDYDIGETAPYPLFEQLMSPLNNAFTKIPNNRFLKFENEIPRTESIQFGPTFLKNWLLRMSLSRHYDHLFQSINSTFSTEPFSHGNISIGRIGDDQIEIFISDQNSLKLPIGRKGTGVQQILTILSFITRYKSPLVGIEELETNLSPKSQTAILESLYKLVYKEAQSKVGQVLLTTHSPFMATQISDNIDRRIVKMQNDGISIVEKPSENDDNFFCPPTLILD